MQKKSKVKVLLENFRQPFCTMYWMSSSTVCWSFVA